MDAETFKDCTFGHGPPAYAIYLPSAEVVARADVPAETFLVLTSVAPDGSRVVTFRKYQDGDVIEIPPGTTARTWSPTFPLPSQAGRPGELHQAGPQP